MSRFPNTTEVAYTVSATIGDGKVPTEVTGWQVAPGLAIGPALDEGKPRPNRYVLIHVPSGKTLGSVCCYSCARIAARLAVANGIDWTRDEATVKADKQVRALHRELFWLCDADLGVTCRDAA